MKSVTLDTLENLNITGTEITFFKPEHNRDFETGVAERTRSRKNKQSKIALKAYIVNIRNPAFTTKFFGLKGLRSKV